MKTLREWWSYIVCRATEAKLDVSPKREQYLMGRCIGCGRCDTGDCPVKVKRIKRQ